MVETPFKVGTRSAKGLRASRAGGNRLVTGNSSRGRRPVSAPAADDQGRNIKSSSTSTGRTSRSSPRSPARSLLPASTHVEGLFLGGPGNPRPPQTPPPHPPLH